LILKLGITLGQINPMLKTATIRDAIYDLVITAASFTSSNTDKAKFAGDSVSSDALPFCIVEFQNADIEYETIGDPRTVRITSNFAVHILAKTQITLDALTTQVLNTFTDRTLSGEVQELILTAVEYQFSSEADAEYGRATISISTQHTSSIND